MTSLTKNFFHFVNLFFPNICPVCGNGLASGENILCISCLYNLPRTNYHDDPDNKTSNLFAGSIPFHQATSLFYYNKHSRYARAIHELKYNGKSGIGSYLGLVLGHELRKSGFSGSIDLIIPVPLHRTRQMKRGFNQSEAIARGIAEATLIPVHPRTVKRVTNTTSQTTKNMTGREENVKNIFELIAPEILVHKHILVVDDVITTGATIKSLVQTIQHVDGIKISIASLGIANT